jgi:hypothetical protein
MNAGYIKDLLKRVEALEGVNKSLMPEIQAQVEKSYADREMFLKALSATKEAK